MKPELMLPIELFGDLRMCTEGLTVGVMPHDIW